MNKAFVKKIIVFGFGCAMLAAIGFNSTSCKKIQSNAPVITFDSAIGYVYDDTALSHGTNFSIWVIATKDGANDLVESGKITKSVNGGPDSVLQTMNFVTVQFSQFYTYIAGDSGNKEKYKFTFYNQNGAGGSDSIIITDN